MFGSYSSGPAVASDGIHANLGLSYVNNPTVTESSAASVGRRLSSTVAYPNPSSKADLETASQAQFRMTVNKRLENPFGSLHGNTCFVSVRLNPSLYNDYSVVLQVAL
jgi:hypothetical protein